MPTTPFSRRPPWRRVGIRPTSPPTRPWLRALVVDGRQVTDTSIDAANLFAAKLKAQGLTVTVVGRGSTTSANPLLASSAGQTVSQIVSRMMLESDNEHAEALHRLVGIKLGYGNTWAAAKSAQAARLKSRGPVCDRALRRVGTVPQRPPHRIQLARW